MFVQIQQLLVYIVCETNSKEVHSEFLRERERETVKKASDKCVWFCQNRRAKYCFGKASIVYINIFFFEYLKKSLINAEKQCIKNSIFNTLSEWSAISNVCTSQKETENIEYFQKIYLKKTEFHNRWYATRTIVLVMGWTEDGCD